MASNSSAIEELTPAQVARRAPVDQRRAPLLWLLCGLIPGYLLAAFAADVAPALPALAAIPLLALALAARDARAWALCFLPGVVLLAWSWAQWRETRPPEIWNRLPPREALVEGRVLEVFPGTTYPDRQYATVELTGAPPRLSELVGQRAFCSLSLDEAHPLVVAGAVYPLRGVVARIEIEADDDFSQYLERAGAHFRLSQGEAGGVVRPPPLWRRPFAALNRQWSSWLTGAPPARAEEANLLGAMLLGERGLLSEGQRHTFLVSGTMHLFAISGLHVMIVGLTLQQILQFLRVRRRLALGAVLGLLFIYVGVTGFSPSALRAFSMMAFYWLAGIFGRAPRPLPAVLASAVVVLLVDPGQLFSVGFQLSYSVVLSILLLGLPLSREILRRWPLFTFVLPEDHRWWQRWIVAGRLRAIESLCISFSATVGSAPLIVLHFEVWTPGAIVLNALLIPLAGLAVATGVLIVVSGTFGLASVGGFLAHGAWLIVLAMEGLVRTAAAIPGSYSERAWEAPAYAYGVLGCFLLVLLVRTDAGPWRRIPALLRVALPSAIVLGGLAVATSPV